MALCKHFIQVVPFVYALQCLTGKVDNNTGRISHLTGLSRFEHQVWCPASIQVACGSSQALEQVSFIIPHLLSCLIYCVCPPVPNW